MNASHHTLGAPKSQAGPGACARHTRAPDFPTGVPSLAPTRNPGLAPTRSSRLAPRGQPQPRPTRATPASSPRAQNGAGADFPTPAPPDKRASRHSMQDTQPSTAVPSNAI